MKVNLVPKEGNKEIWIIFIDEERWREVHRHIFGRRPRLPLEISSLAEWQEAFSKIEYGLAKAYTLRRLSMQSYYSAQLQKLLQEKKISSATIQRLIQECQEWGYLNDSSWLESYMRSHLKRYGLRTVIAKLQAKGVSQETLHKLSVTWRNPEEEKESIRHLLQTRYRSKDLTQYKEKQKVVAALIRKGYSFELIQSVLKI